MPNIFIALSATCTLLFLSAHPLASYPPEVGEPDEHQVEEVIRAHVDALRGVDLDAYMGHFVEDATWQNALGMHLRGMAEIEEYSARVFVSLEGAEWETRDITVQLVTPDVAIADADILLRNQAIPGGLVEEHGEGVLPDRNLLNTYVLTRVGETWLIAAERIRDVLQLEWLLE